MRSTRAAVGNGGEAAAEAAEPTATAGGFLHRFCRGWASLGVALLLACALLTVADILGRRVLGLSLPGLIDLTQLLIMASVFLCIPFAFEQRANVEVDLLFQQLPRGVRGVLAVCWSVLAALFLLLVAWHVGRAASQVLEYGESSATLAVPMIWYWVPILFGTVLAAIVCIQQLLRPISHSDHPQSP
ncbi:MAG TPA: TRAP transporter small permease [Lautropia sp.]|nr:TRAP transporter small permease [Lautropia sp.]